METPQKLVHLCDITTWAAAQRRGWLPVDPAVGFVHLSTPAQVHEPANRFFPGRTDLLLLQVNPDLLTAPLRWEPAVPATDTPAIYPHLYGPLPVAAVVAATPYPPGADGSFPAAPR